MRPLKPLQSLEAVWPLVWEGEQGDPGGYAAIGVGRIRARYHTARLPNPPVRTVRATFIAHGSRDREFMVTSISSGLHRVHGVQLARSLRTLYCFPTLSLRAFALYVAFPHADYYAQSDCLSGLGVLSGISSFLLSTLLGIPCRLSRVRNRGHLPDGLGGVLPTFPSSL